MERLGNLGYFAQATQPDKNTVAIPTFFVPVYDETLTTNANLQKQQPAAGSPFATRNVLRGQRDHQGDVTVPAEPNTAFHIFDNLLSRISSSGAGPYTNVLGYSATVDPKYKTYDFFKGGGVVHRYWGVRSSAVSEVYDNNERQLKTTVSALGSFTSRTIKTVSTTTITLDTKYESNPNKGLVATDLVRIFKESTGAVLDTTVTTVNADGITVVLGDSAAAFAAGDIIQLRPATIAFNLLQTMLWSRTHYFKADTVANAMSATEINVEQGSTYEIMHPFEDDGGSKRSGSADPAALPYLAGDASLGVKKFFDTQEEVQDWTDLNKSAFVIRHYSGDTNQYEQRAAFHSLTTDTPLTNIKPGAINYANLAYLPSTAADGNDVQITVIHGMSSIG
jgi:hypothetical protein